MAQDQQAELSEERRKEVFAFLVEAQDREVGVAQSRQMAVERFKIDEAQVREIEREGMDQQWPPL
jgi:hypothetical protein